MNYNVILSYDLIGEKDYNSLYEYLDRYKKNHILNSTWLLNTSKDIHEIKSDLLDILDEDDKFYIAKLSEEYDSNNIFPYGSLFSSNK